MSGSEFEFNGGFWSGVDMVTHPTCLADIAPSGGNSLVNVADLLAVINSWGACLQQCPPYCLGDVNHDCTVNVIDLLAVINSWGLCP
jgi:hypothetical protein